MHVRIVSTKLFKKAYPADGRDYMTLSKRMSANFLQIVLLLMYFVFVLVGIRTSLLKIVWKLFRRIMVMKFVNFNFSFFSKTQIASWVSLVLRPDTKQCAVKPERFAPPKRAFCPTHGAKRPFCRALNFRDLLIEVTMPRHFSTLFEESKPNDLRFRLSTILVKSLGRKIESPKR